MFRFEFAEDIQFVDFDFQLEILEVIIVSSQYYKYNQVEVIEYIWMKIKFCINCVLFKKLMKCVCKNLWSIFWIRVRLWKIRLRIVLNGENLEIMIFK